MIVAIVQARLGSTRLPGKVLREINGKPLIKYLDERLRQVCGVDVIEYVVPPQDQSAIVRSGLEMVNCFPIPDNDVWLRYRWAIEQFRSPDQLIRICADSPLIDPKLIDYMIEQHEGGITTNTQPRTFPAGQCIEIIDTDVFLAGKPETAYDREHVTPFYYRNFPFKNVMVPDGEYCSEVNMCVDTQDDFDRIAAVVGKMTRPHWSYGWREITELMK